jgi:hypothetical protein
LNIKKHSNHKKGCCAFFIFFTKEKLYLCGDFLQGAASGLLSSLGASAFGAVAGNFSKYFANRF